MKCTKCGKEVKKTDKFCQYCGSEVKEVVEVKETKVTKAEPKKAEVKAAPVTKAPASQGNKGLAIASMILGIVGIILCWCGLWAIIFPILALIFALVSKHRSGFKVAGLVTSIVGLVLQFIITVIAVLFLGTLSTVFNRISDGYYDDIIDDYIEDFDDDYDDDDYGYSYKYASPYGEWTCTPYPEADYTNHDETTLNLKYTGKYVYGPKDDITNNYYAGTFTYESEYDKNAQYTDRKFMKITAPVTEFVMDGVNQSIEGKNLNLEMEFINDYDEAIIMFYNTQNTYYCTK